MHWVRLSSISLIPWCLDRQVDVPLQVSSFITSVPDKAELDSGMSEDSSVKREC